MSSPRCPGADFRRKKARTFSVRSWHTADACYRLMRSAAKPSFEMGSAAPTRPKVPNQMRLPALRPTSATALPQVAPQGPGRWALACWCSDAKSHKQLCQGFCWPTSLWYCSCCRGLARSWSRMRMTERAISPALRLCGLKLHGSTQPERQEILMNRPQLRSANLCILKPHCNMQRGGPMTQAWLLLPDLEANVLARHQAKPSASHDPEPPATLRSCVPPSADFMVMASPLAALECICCHALRMTEHSSSTTCIQSTPANTARIGFQRRIRKGHGAQAQAPGTDVWRAHLPAALPRTVEAGFGVWARDPEPNMRSSKGAPLQHRPSGSKTSSQKGPQLFCVCLRIQRLGGQTTCRSFVLRVCTCHLHSCERAAQLQMKTPQSMPPSARPRCKGLITHEHPAKSSCM